MGGYLIGADVIAERLSISRPKAYELIKGMNDELHEAGYTTIAGKVPAPYFDKKFYGFADFLEKEA